MDAKRACAMIAEYVVGFSVGAGSVESNVHSYRVEVSSVIFIISGSSQNTVSSMFRGSRVSMKQSGDMRGLPVVRLKPLSKEYTIHHTTRLLSLNNVSDDDPVGGSR